MSPLHEELTRVINRFSAENGSDTPDFILSAYLLGCLAAFDAAVKLRSEWYGNPERKTSAILSAPVLKDL